MRSWGALREEGEVWSHEHRGALREDEEVRSREHRGALGTYDPCLVC